MDETDNQKRERLPKKYWVTIIVVVIFIIPIYYFIFAIPQSPNNLEVEFDSIISMNRVDTEDMDCIALIPDWWLDTLKEKIHKINLEKNRFLTDQEKQEIEKEMMELITLCPNDTMTFDWDSWQSIGDVN